MPIDAPKPVPPPPEAGSDQLAALHSYWRAANYLGAAGPGRPRRLGGRGQRHARERYPHAAADAARVHPRHLLGTSTRWQSPHPSSGRARWPNTGLERVHPPAPLAHPLDEATAVLHNSDSRRWP